MKATLLSLIVAFVFLGPIRASMAAEKPDCPDNSCFDTKIVDEQSQGGGCTTYTLEVSQDGSCRYALSHFSIEVPCGQISEVSNSEGWAMEVGTTDPTTGITGIKIDDIKDFGEGKTPESFTVTYTVCDSKCENLYPERVAYKASTCVHYDELEPPYIPMMVSLTPHHLSCAGSGDGAVDVNISGGLEPYSFNWSNAATTEDLSGLSAGTYTLTVSDGKGETISGVAVVEEPAALQLQSEVVDASCSGTGSVNLVVSGGTAPYSYSWSNGATTSGIEDVAGTYSVEITDANGCILSESFQIRESGNIQLSISGGSSCDDNLLEALLSGGTAPYTYEWSTGATSASILATESGTYTLTVKDANGCSASASKTVTTGNAPQLVLVSTDPGCASGVDGSIDLTVEGGSGLYMISWSNGATTEDLQNLSAGTYTVTVSDANGCSSTASAVLSPPQAIYIQQLEVLQPKCDGTPGSISVEAFFGTAPYIYEWSNGESGSSIQGLLPGEYTVTVTDANGCSSSRSFVIIQPNQPQISISGGDCSGTLSAEVTGGTAPYSYQWSNGETSSSIAISAGGTYEVTVTDANGCSSTQSIVASDPASAIELTYEVQEPTCNGDSNGSIDLTAVGGSGPYTYTWSNGATTEDLNGLPAGTYSVTVSNAEGCTSTASITISAPQAIFIRAVEIKKVSCLGEDGSITVEAYFGEAPYTYEWDNGLSGSTISGLAAGSYTVKVTDARGCTAQRTFHVVEESAPYVSITSSGCGETRELSAVVTGGTYPYTYSWSSGETTSIITATSGTYQVTITDAKGCSSSASIQLDATAAPISLEVLVKEVSCAGGSDGEASLRLNGGVAPYAYDWSNGSTGLEARELKAGVYSVKVTDATGCSEMLAFTVNEPEAINIVALAQHDSGCGEPSGSIQVQVQGGTAPYLYTWNTGAETASLDKLSAGVYTLTVEDAKGCVAIRSFIIEDGGGTGGAPTAMLENCADTVICRGTTASLPVHFTGEGPFTFEYTDGRQKYSITTSANPYILEVKPEVLSNYKLLSVHNSCGEGLASGQASIQVSDCNKSQICEDGCFTTTLVKREKIGNCETISLQISTDGNCRYALSHFNVAVGCGVVSSASNSGGWPMELNALDPTTGLYGIKVDEVKDFGEKDIPQSFTLTYTICSEDISCQESISSCGPLVAYKAGTCVYYDRAMEGAPVVDSQLSTLAVTEPLPNFELYPNPYKAGDVLNIKVNELKEAGTAKLTIRSLTGTVIYSGEHEVGPGKQFISLVVPQIPAGSFVVSLEVEGHIISKQLYVL